MYEELNHFVLAIGSSFPLQIFVLRDIYITRMCARFPVLSTNEFRNTERSVYFLFCAKKDRNIKTICYSNFKIAHMDTDAVPLRHGHNL